MNIDHWRARRYANTNCLALSVSILSAPAISSNYCKPVKRTCIPCPRQRGTVASSLDSNGCSMLTIATDAKCPVGLIFAQPSAMASQLPGRRASFSGNFTDRTTTHSGFLLSPTNQIAGPYPPQIDQPGRFRRPHPDFRRVCNLHSLHQGFEPKVSKSTSRSPAQQ